MQETPQEIQHLLVVSLNLPVRTWPIGCGPGLHTVQHITECLEEIPVKIPALVSMDDKRHTEPNSIALEKNTSHRLRILYTERLKFEPTGKLVDHHQHILIATAALQEWSEDIQV